MKSVEVKLNEALAELKAKVSPRVASCLKLGVTSLISWTNLVALHRIFIALIRQNPTENVRSMHALPL